ncbi:MAG: YiiD C-terminal domain-containing protein [Bacteroidota bacterium]
MTPNELEKYLHEHIPVSHMMQVAVITIENDSVVLRAPLAPNINHRETVFGGSASAIAILAAWSLLHVRLRRAGFSSRLVIQRNTMEYELPISGDFIARSFLNNPEKWESFLNMLSRKGKARISVASVLEYEGGTAGTFLGDFVALST